MKHKKSALLLLSLIFLGLATASYFRSPRTIPSGYSYDAPSNMLNAACLATTGCDEYGRYLPWAMRAFDDWRPPLLIYIFAAVDKFHVADLFLGRVITMILGFIGCLIIMLGIYSSPRLKEKDPLLLASFLSFLLLSSWIMVPHRLPLEFGIVVITVAPMMFLCWRLIEKPNSLGLGLGTGISIGLMMYAYFGTKPLFFSQVGLVVGFSILKALQRQSGQSISLLKKIRRLRILDFQGVGLALGVALLMALPTLLDMFGPQITMARLHTTNPEGVKLATVLENFWRHIDLKMFFFSGDSNLRHHTQYKGELNQVFLPLYLVGLVCALRETFLKRDLFWGYILVFFLVSIIPASITNEGIPHSLRTLTCVPPLMVICYLGLDRIAQFLRRRASILVPVALLAFIVWGAREARENVRVYQHDLPQIDQNHWTLHYPYTPPEPKPAYTDHGAGTINERYFRVVEMGDYGYCELRKP